MEQLMNSDGWVSFVFSDGTRKTIHTSLSASVLREAGAVLREGFFFDLERGVYTPFPAGACSVDVTREKPIFESEVLNFADRFI